MSIKVLFVCLGNICRSPTAHGVFEQRVKSAQLSEHISVESAGTADWHIGKSPDARSAAAAARRGYDLSGLRAQQVSKADFDHFDYILAMDSDNLANLTRLKPAAYQGELGLFLPYTHAHDSSTPLEVPDPYYGEGDGFELVLDLVEGASAGLLKYIIQKHSLKV
ncbi:MAG: low molecular weight protein-tyrosine-phosphatase [Spongiibacteraceae bacterium]